VYENIDSTLRGWCFRLDVAGSRWSVIRSKLEFLSASRNGGASRSRGASRKSEDLVSDIVGIVNSKIPRGCSTEEPNAET